MKEKIKTSLKVITLDKILKLSIIVAVLLIGGSVFYYFVISPSHNKKLLDDCLDRAQEKYEKKWGEYCKIDNREIGTDGLCLLSSERADRLRDYKKELEDNCFKKYPVK